MKLIIDIPDEEYKQLHYSRKLEENLRIYVLNGKPYNERPKGEWQPFTYGFRPEEGNYIQLIDDAKQTWRDEEYGPQYICSNCNGKHYRFKYCPDCGARMES